MANILPENKKQAVEKEYRLRLAVVGLLLLSSVIFIVGTLLFPSYILLKYRESSLNKQISILEQQKTRSENDLQSQILQETQVMMKSVEEVAQEKPLNEMIHTIVGNRLDAVAITRISYRRKDGNISVSGVAATRNNLLSYKEVLERQPLFKAAELPVSNLAENRQVPFNITLTLSQ